MLVEQILKLLGEEKKVSLDTVKIVKRSDHHIEVVVMDTDQTVLKFNPDNPRLEIYVPGEWENEIRTLATVETETVHPTQTPKKGRKKETKMEEPILPDFFPEQETLDD